MKAIWRTSFGLSMLLAGFCAANAATVSGLLFCDANHDERIDEGDIPLPGALIVVTNFSGTFSNASRTVAPDGGYVVSLPDAADTYVASLQPSALPDDAIGVLPPGGVFVFTIGGADNFAGDFLIDSASCSLPTPPAATNQCCLAGAGTIRVAKGKPAFVFGGLAAPACGSAHGDSGKWSVLAVSQKLHFDGEVFEIVNCGEITDRSQRCASRFIEFQGAGTLKDLTKRKHQSMPAYFFVHAEDNGGLKKTSDRLYFRACAEDGTILMLISADAANPDNIAPVSVSAGKLAVGTACCKPCKDDGHGKGKGSNKPKHK